jgi:hypothetical protein
VAKTSPSNEPKKNSERSIPEGLPRRPPISSNLPVGSDAQANDRRRNDAGESDLGRGAEHDRAYHWSTVRWPVRLTISMIAGGSRDALAHQIREREFPGLRIDRVARLCRFGLSFREVCHSEP